MIRLLAILALAACASAPPAPVAERGPPAEMWARCPMICEMQGAFFLGVLMPSPEGPPICACAKEPEATPQSKTWDT